MLMCNVNEQLTEGIFKNKRNKLQSSSVGIEEK
jgi:hypothetical protein